MLFIHLLAALLIGVVAALLSLRAGSPGWAVLSWYVLAGVSALATSAAIEKVAEKVRARWAKQRAQGDGGADKGGVSSSSLR